MDNNSSNDLNSSEPSSNAPEEIQETELNHTDKILGIFTEPVKTFETTAKFPVRTIDWLLPVFLFVLFLAFQQVIYHSNPNTAYQLRQQRSGKRKNYTGTGRSTEKYDRRTNGKNGRYRFSISNNWDIYSDIYNLLFDVCHLFSISKVCS